MVLDVWVQGISNIDSEILLFDLISPATYEEFSDKTSNLTP
jgi:hypothetical protein